MVSCFGACIGSFLPVGRHKQVPGIRNVMPPRIGRGKRRGAEGAAELTFRRIARDVSGRMHGNTDVTHQQGDEKRKAEMSASKRHGPFDDEKGH